jgi:hypothetical protein
LLNPSEIDVFPYGTVRRGSPQMGGRTPAVPATGREKPNVGEGVRGGLGDEESRVAGVERRQQLGEPLPDPPVAAPG